jgi:MFS family permease
MLPSRRDIYIFRFSTPMSSNSPTLLAPDNERAGRGAYLALAAALMGWMFDGFEMGVFSLVGRAAVQDLLRTTDEAIVGLWFNVVIACFLVGAATGGVVFGWLGDRIGRVRAMTLSVLTYALFTGLCGLVGDVSIGGWTFSGAVQLGLLRFIASIGMGGEWSLGVALVMEVWPNRSRALMAGLIGAAANVGYLLVGVVGKGLNARIGQLHEWLLTTSLSDSLVHQLTSHDGWRIIMLIGALPALLTFLIRMFVPESEKWEHEQQQGRTSHWQSYDLLGVLIGALGPFLIVYVWAFAATGSLEHTTTLRIIATLLGLVIATCGYTYPVIRYLQRLQASSTEKLAANAWRPTLRRMLLGAGLSGVALLGTWGSIQQAPSYAARLSEEQFAHDSASKLAALLPLSDRELATEKLAQRLFKGDRRKQLAADLESHDAATIQNAIDNTLMGEEAALTPGESRAIKAALEDAATRQEIAAVLAQASDAKENTQMSLAIGAIIGTIGAALMGDWLGRRKAYCLLCLLSLLATWWFYIGHTQINVSFMVAAFLAGTFSASFYGWLPLYLPELFRTNVRATGQGFSFNFGRVLAAIGALQTGTMMGLFTENVHLGPVTILSGHPAACSMISLVYVVGMVMIWAAPETKELPE